MSLRYFERVIKMKMSVATTPLATLGLEIPDCMNDDHWPAKAIAAKEMLFNIEVRSNITEAMTKTNA